MKKSLLTSLTLFAFVCNQTYADPNPEDNSIPTDSAIDLTHEKEAAPTEEPQMAAQDTSAQVAPAPVVAVKEVGKASAEGANAGRSKWGTFALAAGGVAIAVTAIILVAQNRGHGPGSD
ncbi:MAG TPA: hypothetical protein VIJ46_05570 [Rhabdochlamydiaceae bacterium]